MNFLVGRLGDGLVLFVRLRAGRMMIGHVCFVTLERSGRPELGAKWLGDSLFFSCTQIGVFCVLTWFAIPGETDAGTARQENGICLLISIDSVLGTSAFCPVAERRVAQHAAQGRGTSPASPDRPSGVPM
jgi:hypothetical protein